MKTRHLIPTFSVFVKTMELDEEKSHLILD